MVCIRRMWATYPDARSSAARTTRSLLRVSLVAAELMIVGAVVRISPQPA